MDTYLDTIGRFFSFCFSFYRGGGFEKRREGAEGKKRRGLERRVRGGREMVSPHACVNIEDGTW